MSVTVVDASAIGAVVFEEPTAAPILASITGRPAAPAIIRFELANICRTRMLKNPSQSEALLAHFALAEKLDIEIHESDWLALPALAHRWSLSAYDAAYLQLALALRAPLVTLDARLAAAFDLARLA